MPSCSHYSSSLIELDVRNGEASRSSFIVQDYFGYSGFLVFPYEVDYFSFKVCEESCDFDGDCIESIDCFWQDCHFYYVDPTYPRTWEIFLFSGTFFNFFLQRLTVFVKQSFHFFGQCYLKIFYVIVAFVKGDVSLISFSALLSLSVVGRLLFF